MAGLVCPLADSDSRTCTAAQVGCGFIFALEGKMVAKRSRTANSPAQTSAPEVKHLKLKVNVPTPSPGVYANQMLVQQDGESAFLTFILAVPPVIIGDPEEVQQQIAKIDSIEGRFVSQIIIPKSKLGEFAKALQTIADAHLENKPKKIGG
jgi:hypothetical protein